MILSKKKILLISPERWGVSMLSKHHYAIALAKRGNLVYFLNPPSKGLKKVELTLTDIPGLTLVDYSQTIRGLNHILSVFPKLFSLLSVFDIRKIINRLSFQPDIVWSFDPFRFQHLRLFRASVTLFHPVDFFRTDIDLVPARHADIIFSVARPILERYRSLGVPTFFVNHGISQMYFEQKVVNEKRDQTIRCGYVGNLLSSGIHWPNLIQIIAENASVEFHVIGPHSKSNLGSVKNTEHVEEIKKYKNVILYGELPPIEVAKVVQAFDLFLICYDPETVGDVVSNSHKILEYLSTGKVVVSSRMRTYDNLANELFEMVQESSQLPQRFKGVVENIAFYNSSERQAKRIAFARMNSYENQINAIEQLLSDQIVLS